ncbi:MAG: hypothetical protein ACYTFN_14785 [Planctomycetota bacterium]|jgi:hypothetical protein
MHRGYDCDVCGKNITGDDLHKHYGSSPAGMPRNSINFYRIEEDSEGYEDEREATAELCGGCMSDVLGQLKVEFPPARKRRRRRKVLKRDD